MQTHAEVVIVIALFAGCLSESRVHADDKTKGLSATGLAPVV
jgi:hypothetical protein